MIGALRLKTGRALRSTRVRKLIRVQSRGESERPGGLEIILAVTHAEVSVFDERVHRVR